MSSLKIVTWNVNSIRARMERLIPWLSESRPDVLLLQEIKVTNQQFPIEEFASLGYAAAVHGQKTYNGVALLARHPIVSVQTGLDDGVPDLEARFIGARIAGLRILCAYVPNGQSVTSEKYPYKLEWLGRLQRWLLQHPEPDVPTLLGGDMNVAPTDLDLFDPAAFAGDVPCTDAERAALTALKELDLIDVFRERKPSEAGYTFWDYRELGFQKNRGLRIDHFYASSRLLPAILEVEVDKAARKGKGASDHAPLCLTLELN